MQLPVRTNHVASIFIAFVSLAHAQWNPNSGQWGKTDSRDLRIMTWNVQDGLCSTNSKVSGANNWSALARIVAAMKPDVLFLQECADNNGNGTGSNVDSVSNLTTTLNMFLHGGSDSFHGGSPITSYVQLYAPGFDLPFIFVSTITDGFNRNVILSRYPFKDLNGDTKTQLSDVPNLTAELYSVGGNGGIRGFMTAEIDLPDLLYAGDLVAGTCHLKAGSAASDQTERLNAAKNIAYFIDYFWNGGGTSLPDPHGKIADSPAATKVLSGATAFICGGDWNEDEATDGIKGPPDWITKAATLDPAGTDGPDRNRTDMTFDSAVDVFTGNKGTIGTGTTKFDYIAWQDSLVTVRRAFRFDSASVTPALAMPPEIVGFSPSASQASSFASDHRCVVADFILVPPIGCNTAGIDEGFAKLGGNSKYPTFAACGSLGTGGTATVTLTNAAPTAAAFAFVSLQAGWTITLGGTLVPQNASILGPFFTDATGGLAIPGVPGGGGPAVVHVQWLIHDTLASQGWSLSNAVGLSILP